MKKTGCINPLISEMLAYVGHGDKILIADGNYPLQASCEQAKCVYLGLRAGEPTVTAVLETLLSEINVEAAAVMMPEDGSRPVIFDEFEELLPAVELQGLGRWEFYEASGHPKVLLAISTGEKRVYANILLTVGVA